MRSSNSRAFARNRRDPLEEAEDTGPEPGLASAPTAPQRADVEDVLNRWVGGGSTGEVTEGNVTFLSAARRRSAAPADEHESLSSHVTPAAPAGDGSDYTSVLLSFADLPPATPAAVVEVETPYLDLPRSTSASEAANFNLATFYASVHASELDESATVPVVDTAAIAEPRRPARRPRRSTRSPEPVAVETDSAPPVVESEEIEPLESLESLEPLEPPRHRDSDAIDDWSPFASPRSGLLPAPTTSPAFGESEWESAFAAYDGIGTDEPVEPEIHGLTHARDGQAPSARSYSSYVPARAEQSTVPTTLRWRSSRVPHVVIGTVLALLGMFALRAWIVAVGDNTSSHVGVAGSLTALSLIAWWMLVTWPASRIEVTHGVLDYRRGEHHHRFDLRDPQLDVRVSGDPTSSRWNVVIRRPRIDPVVLTTRMVDPQDFMRVVELYRVRPSETEESAPFSF